VQEVGCELEFRPSEADEQSHSGQPVGVQAQGLQHLDQPGHPAHGGMPWIVNAFM